jgi:hypothetical protein
VLWVACCSLAGPGSRCGVVWCRVVWCGVLEVEVVCWGLLLCAGRWPVCLSVCLSVCSFFSPLFLFDLQVCSWASGPYLPAFCFFALWFVACGWPRLGVYV